MVGGWADGLCFEQVETGVKVLLLTIYPRPLRGAAVGTLCGLGGGANGRLPVSFDPADRAVCRSRRAAGVDTGADS
jgi:hypothetical protein